MFRVHGLSDKFCKCNTTGLEYTFFSQKLHLNNLDWRICSISRNRSSNIQRCWARSKILVLRAEGLTRFCLICFFKHGGEESISNISFLLPRRRVGGWYWHFSITWGTPRGHGLRVQSVGSLELVPQPIWTQANNQLYNKFTRIYK